MLLNSAEHFAAQECLSSLVTEDLLDSAILLALRDLDIASPEIVNVAGARDAVRDLSAHVKFEFLKSFDDPCEDLGKMDKDAALEKFREFIRDNAKEIESWLADVSLQLGILDGRVFFDRGVALSILRDIVLDRRSVGLPALSDQDLRTLFVHLLQVTRQHIQKFRESVVLPPGMSSSSQPEVIAFSDNLSKFRDLRDLAFSQDPIYASRFLEIAEAYNIREDRLKTQRNLAIGAAIAGFIGLVYMYTRPSKLTDSRWTPEHSQAVEKRWARTDWPINSPK